MGYNLRYIENPIYRYVEKDYLYRRAASMYISTPFSMVFRCRSEISCESGIFVKSVIKLYNHQLKGLETDLK